MTLGGPYFEAQLVAVLPVHDLDRAELWYGRIGFEVSASYPDYRVLRAGHLILHLRLLDLGEGPSTAGVYLTMPSEDAVAIVHAAWTAAGPGVLTEPMLHPHGLVEFAAEDPDGNLWRIGAPAGTTPAPERAVDSGLAPDRAPGREPGPAISGETDDGPEPATGTSIVGEPDWLTLMTAGHCTLCKLTPSEGNAPGLAGRLRDEAHRWKVVLRDADDDMVRIAGSPGAWSALEYGVHVRDVLAVFTERVLRTLAESDPELGWWDHEAAIADGFANESDRDAVGDDLVENANRLADVLAGVSGDQWERGATRQETERFTVELLARYALHEVVHHRVDAERSLKP